VYTITFSLKFNSEEHKNVKWDVQDSEQIYTPKDATWNITLGQLLREWFQLDMEYDYFIYDGEDHDDVLVKVYVVLFAHWSSCFRPIIPKACASLSMLSQTN
jgi:hypothetical protein